MPCPPRPVLLALLLGALGGPAAATPAPPAALDLSAPDPRAGIDWPVQIGGAWPGETVIVWASTTGPGAGPCAPSGPCLDLLQPVRVGAHPADATGVAAWSMAWPEGSAGVVWVQAITPTGVRSPVVTRDVVALGEDGDGDGLPDILEDAQHVDPFLADTDGDGLDDGEELQRGTLPRVADTDGDGLDDGEEVQDWATDPLVVDTDDDGLSDGDEVLDHGTDPLEPDTDGDGAQDGHEVRLGADPLVADTDGDGLGDAMDFWPTTPGPFDPTGFVVDDVLVSDPSSSLPDAEFDPTRPRFVWQEMDGSALWVGHLDPTTGALMPPDGRAELVDTGVSPISVAKNGPEWVLTARGSEVLYARPWADTHGSVWAWEEGSGWASKPLSGTAGWVQPFGSLEPGDPAPRVRFRSLRPGPGGAPFGLAHGALTSGGAPEPLGHPLGTSRWVPGARALSGVVPVDGRNQPVLFWPATGTYERLVDAPLHYGATAFFSMPELGGELAFVTVRGTTGKGHHEVAVFRSGPDGWVEHHAFALPAGTPWVISPEVFTWRGRSFVSFVASTAPKRQAQPGWVWVASLDPARPLFRRVSGSVGWQRKDPEPVTTGDRPWVYYARITAGGRRHLQRCELGL